MQKYSDVVFTTAGPDLAVRVPVTASVRVNITGTSTAATLYSDNGITTQPNPITTDSSGEYSFYAADGVYDLVISSPNLATETKTAHVWLGSGTVSVKGFGAKGDGVADDTAAIVAAIAAVTSLGGDVLFSVGTYKTTSVIDVPTGVQLVGQGAIRRYQSTKMPTIIKYAGTIAAFRLAPTIAGNHVHTVTFRNLHIDGTNSSGAVDGVLLDASVGGASAVFGILFDDCAITNFPRSQVNMLDEVFDITFRRTAFDNRGRAVTGNLVTGDTAGTKSQITFDNCFFDIRTTALWAVNLVATVRFFGGSVIAELAGAHGIFVSSALELYGTHVEGATGSTSSIGIQYQGTGGTLISPSNCTKFGQCVQIGDGTASPARGWVVAGNVSGFNVGGKGDLFITSGGSRTGVVLSLGFANGTPTITDEHQTGDSTYDVTYLHNRSIQSATTIIAPNDTISGAKGLSTNTSPVITTASASGTSVGNIGGGEDILMNYQLPGNSLSANGKGVEITAWGTTANNTNPKTVKMTFQLATLITTALTVSQAGTWRITASVVRTGIDAQDYSAQLVQGGTTTLIDVESGAITENDGAIINIRCTGTVTDGGGGINNNDIVQEGMIVKFLN